jgi:polar amino acid transport system ATP-binding protein
MLLVTHEMGFAQDISDRVLMLDAGQVVEDSSPEKIFSEPVHQRTRDFLQAVINRA